MAEANSEDLPQRAQASCQRKFDVVVFGASGFTGQFVVEEIARTAERERGPGGAAIKWAVAGRDMKKLQSVLDTASQQTGVSVTDVPIIIADVSNENSLLEMCQQASIVINCVGPYRFYGTPVVKACIESGTHHVDICGEPAWLEQMERVYGSKAKEAGVYVLEACGFDSIPSEMGVAYTRQQFPGILNSIECFIGFRSGNEKGPRLNFGTWQSAIHSVANSSELKSIRKQLHSTPLPPPKHRLAKRSAVFRSDTVNGWCVPFLGADKAIVYRSVKYNYEHRKQTPIQFQPYLRLGSFFSTFATILAFLVFGLLCKSRFGRHLLEKYPEKMSFGFCSKTGPSRKQIEGSSFRFTLVALGYEAPTGGASGSAADLGLPTKRIVTTITGPEVGYVTTPICVVQAAYVLLKEKDKLPKGGGVFTPGAAFAETTLLDRLQSRDIKFSKADG